MRIEGATKFPRAMAFGAAGDEQLAFEAGRVTARRRARAGRPRQLRAGRGRQQQPAQSGHQHSIVRRGSGARRRAGVRVGRAGLQQGGMLATLKHFPGHGDTAVDSHLGLPVIPHPRERLDQVELAPFSAGIAAGAAGVMVGAHRAARARSRRRARRRSAGRSSPVCCARQLGFDGLIYSDAMDMDAVTKLGTAGENAVKAVLAGIDVVLDSRDTMDAFRGAEGGGRFRPDSARAPRGVGAPHPHREGQARAASHARGEHRIGAAGRRDPARMPHWRARSASAP